MIIHFDPQVALSLASGSPFDLISMFFDVFPSIFEYVFTFWHKIFQGSRLILYILHLSLWNHPFLQGALSLSVENDIWKPRSECSLLTGVPLLRGPLTDRSRKNIHKHTYTCLHWYLFLYIERDPWVHTDVSHPKTILQDSFYFSFNIYSFLLHWWETCLPLFLAHFLFGQSPCTCPAFHS